MKKFKKLAAAILACALALSMSITAMAASTITIEGNGDHTYKAYQILTGTLENGILTEVVWGDGVTATGQAALGDAAAYAETITTASMARKMARTLVDNDYLDNANTLTHSAGVHSISGLEEGYYLITDTVAGGSDEVASSYIVKVVEGDTVVVSPKVNVPEMEKKVTDTNDSTGADSALQDSADFDIGDTVTFTITVALPEEYPTFESYYLAITDHLSAGLDLVEDSFELYYNNGAGNIEIADPATAVGAEVVYADGTDTNHFKYAIKGLKDLNVINKDSEIVLTYQAIVNESAKIGEEGNPNTAYLTYQTDPYYNETFVPTAPENTTTDDGNGNEVYDDQPDSPVYDDEDDPNNSNDDDNGNPKEGDPVVDDNGTPDNPSDDTPVTSEDVLDETPDDTVIVFTYQLAVNKVDEEGAALAGAAFTLYKQEEDGNSENNDDAEQCTLQGYTDYYSVDEFVADGKDTTFTFKGLDDGNYLLVETTTPVGYNPIDPIPFTISAGHQTTSDDPQLESITISDAAFSGDVATGVITTDVVNESGVVLPETGGIGTTIFYVLGAVLVIGAGVLLVTKKRMENK